MEIDQWREPGKVARELGQQPFGNPGFGGFVLPPFGAAAMCGHRRLTSARPSEAAPNFSF